MASRYDQFEPDNWIGYGVVDRPHLPATASFLAGTIIQGPLPVPLVFGVNHLTRAEVPHFIGGSVPIFSMPLLAALRQAGVTNIQAFDVVLHSTTTGENWPGFHAVNVVGLVRAANMALSIFDQLVPPDDDGLDIPLVAFKKLVLDAKKMPLPTMFRLAESPDVLLLDNRVVAMLDDAPPPEGWQFDTVAVEHA